MRFSALWIGLGIFLSRIAGLVREKIFAHYFGNSYFADAFRVALRIPNFLQNLLGEGALSASMIPVYSKLLAENKSTEAELLARNVGTWLLTLSVALCSLGVIFAPALSQFIAPGFSPEKSELTTQLVRIFFPGVGLLVMSAWCLGILNSHHKFFLSYVAPVLWNAAIISALLYFGPSSSQEALIIQVSWALLVGCLLQVVVQIPSTLKFFKVLSPTWSVQSSATALVFKNFLPVVFSRGIVQISSWIDSILASRLIEGSVSTLSYAQTLYLLPVSLFGISISASELPTMSRSVGSDAEIASALQARLKISLTKLNFFVIPISLIFIVFGAYLVAMIFQGGAFVSKNTLDVWYCLAASSLGLLATTESRLYASTFYALKDTRTPLRFSILRVITSTSSAIFFAFYLPTHFPEFQNYATAGLALGFSVAGWAEWIGLRWLLKKRIGAVPAISLVRLKYFFSALIAIVVSAIAFQNYRLGFFNVETFVSQTVSTQTLYRDAFFIFTLFTFTHGVLLLILKDPSMMSVIDSIASKLIQRKR